MAIPHANSGEVIDVRPLNEHLKEKITSALIKTDTFEVLRLVLPAETTIARHQVPGAITVQCLEGRVTFDAGGINREMTAGQMLYLDGSTPHALYAIENSSVLVTIILHHKPAAIGS